MNEYDLNKELARNDSEKQIIKEELIVSQNKWAEYVLKHKNEINSIHYPIIVKKKKRIKFNEFIYKIKTILGFTKKKNSYGIEAYL